MGDPPSGTSLDHIDYNGDYTPANCQWASKADQLKNRRVTLYFEFQCEQVTLAQLAREYGVARQTLYYRVVRYGWDLERAVTMPVQQRQVLLDLAA